MKHVIFSRKRAAGAALTLALGAGGLHPAAAQTQLITNGGFENGAIDQNGNFTAADWTVSNEAGSDSTFYFRSDDPNSNESSQNNGEMTVGPASGTYYAVSDQEGGPGATALTQMFTVPSTPGEVVLTFDMFVDNYADPNFYAANTAPIALDDTVAGSQQARVDILPGKDTNAFDTGTGVTNLYYGTDPNPDYPYDNPHQYTPYTYDITNDVTPGSIYQLRFAEVNNEDNLYQGIDNVSITDTPNASPAPEPSQMALFAFVGLSLAGLTWRARRRTLA